MKDDGCENGKTIKFYLLEGERIIGLVVHDNVLWVKTNLDRYFRSTNTPIENIDFVEVGDKMSPTEKELNDGSGDGEGSNHCKAYCKAWRILL